MVTVVEVVLVLVSPSVVDDDSSEVEVVSEIELSDLAHEFIFRLKKKISKIIIITSITNFKPLINTMDFQNKLRY